MVVEVLIDGIISNQVRLNCHKFQSRLGGRRSLDSSFRWTDFIGGPTGAIVVGEAKKHQSDSRFVNSHGWSLRGPSLAATAAALDRSASEQDRYKHSRSLGV